ncbi:glycosyltransferase family 2 protein [Lysinibacter sp. HNR]|uniref:glycosyltransferase family 2 protein n=1 Tax=Lysinibacter sp. HNR TaxID=3031408 RepID=UPI0024347CDA|nr:glycosyltransferase family 2 protein [Lysinibacter sp. HNR]WGD38311.1 glycosyltransferase family 2 protein [Lysinibacter sp. HNR]
MHNSQTPPRDSSLPTTLPGVSYIVPVLNEEKYIAASVSAILLQEYSGPKEVILALGPSTDNTNKIVSSIAANDPRVILVDNPGVDIPVGLNLAINRSQYPIIIRVDAHSELSKNYTHDGVHSLLTRDVANVGGIMHAQGRTPFQQAIARAYNSPFGLGGGAYHGSREAGPAESAYLGIFRRDVLFEAGLYDESIRRGEDWELNLRIRNLGYTVWFDPDLRVTYWPRDTWQHLTKQFIATGTWRAELVRRYGGRNPWRFFVPPALVLTWFACVVLALLQATGIVSGIPSLLASALYLGPLLYVCALLLVSLKISGPLTPRDRLYTLVVFATMHLSWGAGFLIGLIRGGQHSTDRSRLG